MAFEKVATTVDFPALERDILALWDRIGAFEARREKNRGGPKWSFLDGPITANNPMGVHHAWGRTYKDAFQRYRAMTGCDLRYQNGFDCQGLWVEVEVEKQLGIRSKRDIEELVPGDRDASIDRFVTTCKDRVNKFARVQTEQSIRLGYWMDWDRTDADWAKPPGERKSYFTMSEENNFSIWSFLKKCHSRGLVYRGYDAMPWCARCGTGISQMEMNEGYQLVAHRAVFVRLPLRDRPNECLLVWTTTPWTLPSNVGAAVNPELTYLKVRQGEQVYYLAKGAFTAKRLEEQFKRKEWVEGVPKLKTLEQLFKEKPGGYEIVGELRGADLLGWAYDGPFDEFAAPQVPHGYPAAVAEVVKQQNWSPAVSAKQAHRVIAWDAVGETEGTGIVHIAPGCGREDFQLGKTQGLPPIAPLDEFGCFLEGFGPLSGMPAYGPEASEAVVADLTAKGRLFATEKYPHSYPHCWRCKTELLFRLVDEWFIAMTWRDEIKAVADQVTWLPESINGKARENDWLTNMGDWMISKKRYWGLALPIWVDSQSGDFEVIGSREELRERAVEGWDAFEGHTPHRPWIDRVKIKNPKTGNLMSRIPDVGNPWLDAGIVPYSTMGYRRDRESWEEWFPADFVTECFPGQFRNWFYALLAMSTMMENRPPFRTLLGHALVRDEKGKEMHKSAGNAIAFEEAAETMGADVCRWLYCRSNPAQNINFGYGPGDEVRNRFVLKLWNTYAFFCNYARLDGFDPAAPAVPMERRPDLDRWILSDLQALVQQANAAFELYNLASFCLEAEQFVDDRLSNWYIRRSRRRFWKSEQGDDKLAAYQTLYTVLRVLTRLCAPIVPFLTEAIWQNIRENHDPASVHLTDYPKADASLIDTALSDEVNALLRVVSLGLSARNTAKIKVRQPLAELVVQAGDDAEQRAVTRFGEQIAEELNVKAVRLHDATNGDLLVTDVKANLKTLGPKAGGQLQAVKKQLEAMPASEVRKHLATPTPWELAGVVLTAEDVTFTDRAPEGWSGVADRATQVMLDVRLTDALKSEGLAREIVRHVQDQRKKAGLQPEDRIALVLESPAEVLQQAITDHGDTIRGETLAVTATLPDGASHRAEVQIEGLALSIALAKVTVI